MRPYFVLFALAMLIFCSCARKYTYLTDKLIDKNKWSLADLEQMQFITSEGFEAFVDSSSQETSIKRGVVYQETIDENKQVIVEAGELGALIAPLSSIEALNVGFHEKDEEKFFLFKKNPDSKGRYTLDAKYMEGIYNVAYMGEWWLTTSKARKVALFIDLRKKTKIDQDKDEAPGRRPAKE